MRVAITSDTHGRSFVVPPCDVFIHAGDLTAGGSLSELRAFAVRFLKGVQAQILIVPGNHDNCFQDEPGAGLAVLQEVNPRVQVLIDSGAEIEGVRFYGSPWSPPFMDWCFMATE